MKQKKSEYLSSFGIIFKFVKKIMDALNALGGNDEDLHRVLTEPNLAMQIAELIMASRKIHKVVADKTYKVVVDGTYKVVIDYSKSVDEMIKAGNYGSFHSDVTQFFHSWDWGTGKREVELVLVHANQEITSEEVEKDLRRMRLKPAKFEHLLAFGATYPEVQMEFQVIALGSLWFESHREEDNTMWIAYLAYKNGKRVLDQTISCDASSCRFLAVRKK